MWESLELESGPGTMVGQIEAVAQAPQQILVQQAQGAVSNASLQDILQLPGYPSPDAGAALRSQLLLFPRRRQPPCQAASLCLGMQCSSASTMRIGVCRVQGSASGVHRDSSQCECHRAFPKLCADIMHNNAGKGCAVPLKGE